jgi:RNA polymerase sigma factor (sigma-70 family)
MCLLTRSGGVRRTTYPLRGEEILAAVPSIGRAVRVEGAPAPEADLTRALYEQYANQIFRYCLHQLGSREEAEDAVQSTFLNAFRGIKRGVVPELESAWLFKIAHNVCLSRRRTSWRRGRIESPTDFGVVEEMTPAPSRRADELMGLQDVLEQMPENQRRAILLREWQGLSYREIGEELELSQAAVETLIFRARRSLAAGLEQPPEAKKRKLVRGADLGNVLAAVKSLLVGGGAAAKVAATVAVVSASTVVVAAPVQQHQAKSHHPAAPAAPASTAHPTSGSTVSVAGPVTSFPGAGAKRRLGGAHGPAPDRFTSLGSAASGAYSRPDESTIATAPPEQAPIPVGPAPTEQAAPPAGEPPSQVTPQPTEPQHTTPTPTMADKQKTEGASTPAGRSGDSGDKGGDTAKNGDTKSGDTKRGDTGSGEGKASTPAAIPRVTVTLPVVPVAPSTKGTDAKGSDPSSKGGDPRGNDSKKGDDAGGRDGKRSSAPATPAVTLSVQPATGTTDGRKTVIVATVTTPTATAPPANGDAKKGDSDTKGPSTQAPAPVAAPPATVTLPVPVATLTSVAANLGAAVPASIQASEGKTKDKARSQSGDH